ncbi:hypothetical protein MCEZLEM10_00515 [Methylophilaceae bacterium]
MHAFVHLSLVLICFVCTPHKIVTDSAKALLRLRFNAYMDLAV